MALSKRRSLSRPVNSRRMPPANAGALAALGHIGAHLRTVVDAGHGLSADDCVLLLAALRPIYRVVRAMRPPA